MGGTHATLSVDGAARGNPGPAGVAAVLVDESGNEVFVAKAYIGEATNNVAEYRALILGLTESAPFASDLVVHCDSELVVRQVNGEYKVKNPQLKELIGKVAALASRFDSIEVRHVPRELNARADAAANEAIDDHLVDGAEELERTQQGQERLFDV